MFCRFCGFKSNKDFKICPCCCRKQINIDIILEFIRDKIRTPLLYILIGLIIYFILFFSFMCLLLLVSLFFEDLLNVDVYKFLSIMIGCISILLSGYIVFKYVKV
jgi:hypothetical protein